MQGKRPFGEILKTKKTKKKKQKKKKKKKKQKKKTKGCHSTVKGCQITKLVR